MKKIEVVVTGLSIRLPHIKNLDEFWHLLIKGETTIRRSELKNDVRSKSRPYSLFDNIESFDHQFFNISEREAKSMDPQQRILLEECYQCIQNSGVSFKKLKEGRSDVYIGMMGSDYGSLAAQSYEIDSYSYLGCDSSIHANRISHFFDLKGKSIPVETASSSSLVAIDQAIQSIRNQHCDYAIVAGVNINFYSWKANCFDQSMMLSSQNGSRPFDKGGEGYAIGDGVVVMLLQSKESALKNNQKIYGILKGSASFHGGRSNSLFAPKVEAQQSTMLEALRDAKIASKEISYVEAHGSGTPIGDPIEYEALMRVYGKERINALKVGSLKANVGHLEAAAGIIGLTKVLLMMEHKQIPPTIQHNQINPFCSFAGDSVEIVNSLSKWRRLVENKPLLAGVSSFGIGGVNAHVIVEEYKNLRKPKLQKVNSLMVPISAKSENSIKGLIKRWKKTIKETNDPYSLVASLAVKSLQFAWRSSCYLTNKDSGESLFTEPRKVSQVNQVVLDLSSNQYTIEHFSNISEGYVIFDNIANKLRGHLDKVLTVKQELDKPNGKLNSFFNTYVFCQGLFDLGLKPDVIIGSTSQSLLILTLSEAISLKDALCFLIEEDRTEIQFSIPQSCVHIGGTKYDPYNITNDYLGFLVKNGVLSKEVDLKVLVKHLAEIYQSDQEFRNLTANIQIDDYSFQDLFNIQAIEDINPKTIHYLLFGGIVGLNQLMQKWQFNPEDRYLSSFGKELKHLITSQVIDIDSLRSIFDSSILFEYPDQRIKPYEGDSFHHLVDFNEPAIIERLKSIELKADVVIEGNIQENKSTVKKEIDTLIISMREDLSFLDIVSSSWNLGMSINWDVLFPSNSFIHKLIPDYYFEKKNLWLNVDLVRDEITEVSKSVEHSSSSTCENDIVALISSLIGMDASKINREDRLSEIGIDSIIETGLKYQIEQRFQLKIPSFIMANGDLTIKDLIKYIQTESKGENLLQQFISDQITLNDLSEKQVDQLLAEMINDSSI